jgi:uncharacterized protein YfiM (DUF2279 family)
VKKAFLLLVFLCPLLLSAQQQDSIPQFVDAHPDKSRVLLISGIHAGIYAGTLVFFSQSWYKDYPRSSFHTFNDAKEWQQMDKVGHAWGTYNTAKYSTAMWQWTGLPDKKAIVFGGISSIGYFTIVETMDAHSEGWGWSWGDMAANVSGIGLYTLQELTWKEQRIQYKFSSHSIHYEDGLEERANDLFGSSLPQRLLKDYNAQTYWWSINLSSFSRSSKWPRWLNVAVGYGAKGMYGGFENLAYDKSGNLVFDRRDIERRRQWYLSPDIDLTRIRTNKKGVRTALYFLNMLKFPAPALEYSDGEMKIKALVF